MRARIRKSTLDDGYQFVTFVLGRMKLSIEHRKSAKGMAGKRQDTEGLGSADTTVRTRVDGPTAESNVACKWIYG